MKLFNLAIIRILEANHNCTTDLEKEKKVDGLCAKSRRSSL
jgi:hypothetical protein